MLRFGSRNDVNATFKCTVRLLDDTEVLECEFQANYEGKDLLDQVCQQLNLVEKDYFGLRYVDLNKQRHWLDLNKTIVKQVKYLDPLLFSFRVKFYPPDPFRLKEEITRYQVYLQLRRDLLHGRLYCTNNEASLLAAYVVQADLGDYNPEEHEGNYVQDLRLLLKQTPQIEEKIMELHQTHLVGQSPQEVETNFLRRACSLDTYGVDPHPVKDHRGNQLYLGINHLGILTFQGSRKTHHFRWPEVHKINYEGKMFIVHLTYNEDPRTKTVGFKCPTGAACRHVWRCAIEQMLFFTLPSGSVVPVVSGGSFFSWGTKFKYTGRTERELLEEVGPLRQEEPVINRLGSLRRKASSVPATPSSPTDMSDICYGMLPRSNHSVPDSRLDGGPSLLASNDEGSFCIDNGIPLLETVSEDQEVHSRQRNTERDLDMMDGTVPGMNEYYLRDSYDQSSSESQLVDGQGRSHRSSRSQTPVTRGKTGSRLSLNSGAVVPAQSFGGDGSAVTNQDGISQNRMQLRASYLLPALALTAVLLAIFLAIVLESSEDGPLGYLRRLPEVVAVRSLYYEPAKEFLRDRFSAWTE